MVIHNILKLPPKNVSLKYKKMILFLYFTDKMFFFLNLRF